MSGVRGACVGASPAHPPWFQRSRFSSAACGKRKKSADVTALVENARHGVPKTVLAEQFKISHSSVKRILAEYGVRYGTGRYKHE